MALGVLAFAAIVVTGVVIVNEGSGPSAAPGPAPTVPASGPADSTPPTSSVPPDGGPSRAAPGSDGAGGLSAARDRVSLFVAALNRQDFPRANSFLCGSMMGRYGPSSMEGIVAGSLEVGGVFVQGDTGTTIVTYRTTDGSDTGRVVFGLVVEHHSWMVCDPH